MAFTMDDSIFKKNIIYVRFVMPCDGKHKRATRVYAFFLNLDDRLTRYPGSLSKLFLTLVVFSADFTNTIFQSLYTSFLVILGLQGHCIPWITRCQP